MKQNLALLAILGMIVVGCGGGSGATDSTGSHPTGSAQTGTVGDASITYQGALRAAVTATGPSVTSVGVSGASISAVAYYPSNNIADTNIVYEQSGDIYSYSERTGASTDISHDTSLSTWPSCSNTGTVAFIRSNANTGASDIWEMHSDGTNQTKITSGALYYSVSINPAGNALAAVDGSGNLYRISPTGVATLLVAATSIIVNPSGGTSWSPDGSRIAFGNNGSNFYTIPYGGGTPTLICTYAPFQYPTWSPDSTKILVAYKGEIISMFSAGPSTQVPRVVVGSSTLGDIAPSYSPDGKKISYIQTGSGQQLGLFTCDPNGLNSTYIAPYQTSYDLGGSAWTGYLPAENMVGTGGLVTTGSSSGFVVTNGSKGFGSLLSFAATTPSTAVVTSTSSNSGPIAFTVTANTLTSASWINSYFGPPITKNFTSIPQLVFGVDGTTGAVSFVATAVNARMSAIAKVSSGSKTIYSGRFASVYDGRGTNLAPSGATTIIVDDKTNQVLSTK